MLLSLRCGFQFELFIIRILTAFLPLFAAARIIVLIADSEYTSFVDVGAGIFDRLDACWFGAVDILVFLAPELDAE